MFVGELVREVAAHFPWLTSALGQREPDAPTSSHGPGADELNARVLAALLRDETLDDAWIIREAREIASRYRHGADDWVVDEMIAACLYPTPAPSLRPAHVERPSPSPTPRPKVQ
jgi:hypothetical protein